MDSAARARAARQCRTCRTGVAAAVPGNSRHHRCRPGRSDEICATAESEKMRKVCHFMRAMLQAFQSGVSALRSQGFLLLRYSIRTHADYVYMYTVYN